MAKRVMWKHRDDLVKYRVTVSGTVLRQLALFDTFNIHVAVGSTKEKIARYVMKTLHLNGFEYRCRLLAQGEVRIWVVGEMGGVRVERIQDHKNRNAADLEAT